MSDSPAQQCLARMREVRRDNTPAKVGLVGKLGKFTPEENKEARRAVEAEGRFDMDICRQAFKGLTAKKS